MKALRFHKARDLRLEEVPAPEKPVGQQVVLKISHCGICGTDLHEYVAGPIILPVEPHPETGAKIPIILGHEFSAVVTTVGPDVTTVRPGDRVAILHQGRLRHSAVLSEIDADSALRVHIERDVDNDAWMRMPMVASAQIIDTRRWRIRLRDGVSVSELAKAINDCSFGLLELRADGNALEDIFVRIATQPDTPEAAA